MSDSIYNPQRAMIALEDGTMEAIREFFPIEGKKNTLHIDKVYMGPTKDLVDLKKQKEARLKGRSWSAPVYADVRLVDNATGNVISSKKKHKLANLPFLTDRLSFIVDGTEYQSDHQWRLKSGVYSRRKDNGELEAQFNLAKGRGFRMGFDPEKRRYTLTYGSLNVPLYPVLKALGVSDDQMRATWGPDLHTSSVANARPGYLQKLAKLFDRKADPKTEEEAAEIIHREYSGSELRPDSVSVTLGKPFSRLDGDVLLRASEKLLNINKGTEEVDNRDSLLFKELWSVEDHIPERVRNSRTAITRKIRNNLDRKDSVGDILTSDVFNVPIKSYFTVSSLAQQSDQVNPLDIMGGYLRTTIMGTGGISTDRAIGKSAKLIDASHFGFVDPVHTPEGSRAGVTGHLAEGVAKRRGSHMPLTKVYDPRTKEYVFKDPVELSGANVAFPDQYTSSDKEQYVPKDDTVAVLPRGGGDLRAVAAKDVDYILPSSRNAFSVVANLVPFLPSDQANRAGMATRHMSQAISLRDREEPLVQTDSGSKTPGFETNEANVGHRMSTSSPVDGVVSKITNEEITITPKKGKPVKIPIYHNFPLNEKTAFLNSSPVVAVGDEVKAHQTIADTNFTRDGVLALGTNLRVAYIPMATPATAQSEGAMNFEDGITISEAAAEKLTSQHMHKKTLFFESNMEGGLKKFRANYPGSITDENAEKLDEEGIIQVGQVVQPGDTIIAALQEKDPDSEQILLRGIHRTLAKPYSDKSVKWEKPRTGVVVDVAREGKKVKVHIRTLEPAQIGDKLCFTPDHDVLTSNGWLPVAEIRPGDLAASLNPETHQIEYVPVANTHQYECEDDPLYTLETSQVSMSVTLDHKVYANPRGQKPQGLYPVRDLVGKRYRLKMDGEWEGTHVDTFTFPALEVKAGQGGVGTRTLPAIRMPIQDFLFLLGAYISEGNCYGKDGTYYIEITQIRRAQRAQLEARLEEAGIHFTDTGDKVRIHGKQLYLYFSQFGRSYEKFLPNFVFNLPQEDLHVLYEWMMWGDGSRSGSAHSYSTTSEKLADDFQRLLLHLGMAGRITTRPAGEGLIKGDYYTFRPLHVISVYRSKLNPTINHGHAKSQDGQVEQIRRYTGRVYCPTLERNHVLYTRRNGKCHWSGNSGRHGNKGVITHILPTEEMPKDKDGNPIDIALNPTGVPGRINPSQILETVLGKVAHHQGRVYVVDNFPSDGSEAISSLEKQTKTVEVKGHYRTIKLKGGGTKRVYIEPYSYEREVNYQELVDKALAESGLSETEELFSGVDGKSLGQVLVGRQYIIKLMHQVEKKLGARAHGAGYAYDLNNSPKGGGEHGKAQRFSQLGLYAMLAHGAIANIRETMTWKSDKAQDDVWTAIQMGMPLPTPQTSFAYSKFLSYLAAVGINVEKEGNELHLLPLTDAQILEQSNGEITEGGRVIRGKDLKPEKNGLFDEKITGGIRGKNWSHLALNDNYPNPVYEKAIRSLLGLKGKDFQAIIEGKAALLEDGEVTTNQELFTVNNSGPSAIANALSRLDMKEEKAQAEEQLKTARRGDLDKANKKMKYILALEKAGMSPEEAYTLKNIPVIPPIMRPMFLMEGGDLNVDGLNMLYRDVAILTGKTQEAKEHLTRADVASLQGDVYEAITALFGTTSATKTSVGLDGEERAPGILTILSGVTSPKQSYFHKSIMDRRQDITMRGVITPDMNLHLDQVGLPRKAARLIFQPFVVKELVSMGFSPLQAKQEIEKDSSLARRALEVAMSKRPVMIKRDPLLHKYGIMAFDPVIHEGKSIKIHPLVVGPFNADFDGDTMSVFTPISQAAVDEAQKMKPSANIFSVATSRAQFQPSLEAQLGLYLLTEMGKSKGNSFSSPVEAIRAARDGKISFSETIRVGNIDTTAGRLAIHSAMPDAVKQQKWLTDPEMLLDKGNLQGLMAEIGRKAPKEFPQFMDKLKELGFKHSHNVGFSYKMSDFKALSAVRAKHVKAAEARVDKLRKKGASQAEIDAEVVAAYLDADAAIKKDAEAVLDKDGNRLRLMNRAGIKPGWAQLKQILIAPLLLENAYGEVIPTPVTRSYSEGLDLAGYWTASSGARKGLLDKGQSVVTPGIISKQLANMSSGFLVTENDCGTTRGVAMKADDPDLVDRYLAQPVKVGNETIKANTLITPKMLGKFKTARLGSVVARSALKCKTSAGMCAHCYGAFTGSNPPEVGTNVGLLSSQSIGEKGTQAAMRVFHGGGLASRESLRPTGVTPIERTIQLVRLPKILPGAATLSTRSAKVESIKPSSIGGWDIKVGDEEHYVPGNLKPTVKVGQEIKKGDALSTGPINPHELLPLAGLDRTQQYLTAELSDIYKQNGGVRKRASEVLVKQLTNLGTVEDAGDSTDDMGVIRGDFMSVSGAKAWNKENPSKAPIQITPILRGVETMPLDQTTDWAARMQYRRLKTTLTRGAEEGWKTDIHGQHPIPGIMYSAEFGLPKDKTKGPY